MSPRQIVQMARQRGIEWLAVTDHNSMGMVEPVAAACAEVGVQFLYGMELQTTEEVHLLAYFDAGARWGRFAETVDSLLPDRPNDPEYFGDQVRVDLEETIIGLESRLLVNSLELGFDDAVSLVRRFGGLPVPAHVDRETYGLIAQLGLVPEGLTFDLVETVSGTLPEGFGTAVAICSSDAHSPEQIGQRTTRFRINACTVQEMVLAAHGVGGRSVVCCLHERRMQ